MSAQGVADKVAETVTKGEYDFVMCNFAPPDMVRALEMHLPHKLNNTSGWAYRRVRGSCTSNHSNRQGCRSAHIRSLVRLEADFCLDCL
jgi:hypothetical protein